ncbi:sarcosine oxidase subunit gamma [Schlegelella sp. S2-27]|uniref:Sarcosine oxidase subunit gamma n=1 Tax=Caldimonas mangrovi TaxID=2944811 RepID=A0ABT0YQ44_9BURK|nr:sarcosine oxidase subunit gamma family protein [Caldimonas mangrovi]MCM5680534.1 sarcosine oxidase subunit gamma [Caldimonas mangrovi]
MLEVLHRTAEPGVRPLSASAAPAPSALIAGWREGLAIVNLRGDAEDAAFRRAAAEALGVALPTQAGATSEGSTARVVWAGPDDWFVIGPKGHAEGLATRLREALAGQHHAVTDVSSGYTVLHLSGTPTREVLAQGCPLDLHPRAFKRGACAGSHFFKASVWLWQTDEAPEYELLVRRSFMGYVWLMLERTAAECGLVTRRFA